MGAVIAQRLSVAEMLETHIGGWCRGQFRCLFAAPIFVTARAASDSLAQS
jgi:hypothetical protein